MQAVQMTPTHAIHYEDKITEVVSLPPKISTTVSLGIFEKNMPEPEFEIEYSPADTHDNVRAMFVRMPIDDEYRLQCIFQNFTTQTYKAIIKEKHA